MEIGVQRENLSGGVNFREPDQAGVGQGHWPVAIAKHQRPYIRLLVLLTSAMRITPRSSNSNRASALQPSRFRRNAASVRTGSHVSSGGRNRFHCSTAQAWCLTSEARKLTTGPVSSRHGPFFNGQNLPCIPDSPRDLRGVRARCPPGRAPRRNTRARWLPIPRKISSPDFHAPAKISSSVWTWPRARVGPKDRPATSVKSFAQGYRSTRRLAAQYPPRQVPIQAGATESAA